MSVWIETSKEYMVRYAHPTVGHYLTSGVIFETENEADAYGQRLKVDYKVILLKEYERKGARN